MRRRASRLWALLLTLLLAGCGSLGPAGGTRSATAPADPEAQLDELTALYAARWSNHAEIFAAREAGQADADNALIDQSIERVDAPQFGRRVYRVRIGFGPRERQRSHLRLVRFAHDAGRGLLRQDVYAFPDPAGYATLDPAAQDWAALAPDRLRPSPGCSLWWQRRDDGRWVGATDAGQCASAELGEASGAVTEWLQLDAAQLRYQQVRQNAAGEAEIVRQYRFQRARDYTAWYALHPDGDRASSAPAANQWHTGRDLRLHDQGGRVELRQRDGSASGYSLELARVTYPGQPRSFLRLAFIDRNGRSLGYVFATDDSRDIGVNLGWLQAGLLAVDSN